MLHRNSSTQLTTWVMRTLVGASLLLGSTGEVRADDSLAADRVSLYDAVNSEWLQHTVIPSDKLGVTNFSVIKDSVDAELRTLLEASEDNKKSSVEAQKARVLYQSFVDFKVRDGLGIDPIEDDLEAIDDAKDHHEIALLFAKFLQAGISTPVVWIDGTDLKNSNANLLWVAQSGLGMPARAMYLDTDERSQGLRAKYLKHLTNLLALAEIDAATDMAADVVRLESSLASIQWTPEMTRDVQRTYSIRSVSEVAAMLSSLPVLEMLKLLQIPDLDHLRVNVAQLSYIEAFKDFFTSQSVESWKNYLRARLVLSYSHLLTSKFHEADLEYQKELGFVQGDAPLWLQGVQFVQSTTPMLVGKLFVERYFDVADRQVVQQVVEEIRESAKETITHSSRFSNATRARALKKLEQMTFNIGFPDTWRDYSSLEFNEKELVKNYKRAALYELNRSYSKLTKPVDRSEWERSPHEVNAFYDSTQNKFVLLAGILRAPFFEKNPSHAARLGGLGFVIGHEIGHAFDDSGSQFDEGGNLNNWWNEKDRAAFDRVRKAYIRQANAFEILPGTHLNGELQIGEILGDATGAQLALHALNKIISAEKLDRNEEYRQFFFNLAKVWREKYRPEVQKLILATDPHPPGKFRTDGIVTNITAFHEAFHTKPGDPMYRKPADRLQVW